MSKSNCDTICKTVSASNPAVFATCRTNCAAKEKQIADQEMQNIVKAKELVKNEDVIELQRKIRQMAIVQYGIASLGTVGGFVYANKTGGGFLRYIGFGIIGGIAGGSLAYLGTMTLTNKYVTELEKLNA
jgi:hypothetical protein